MEFKKKLTAVALAATLTAGAGVAFAQTSGSDGNTSGGPVPAAEVTRALGTATTETKFVPITPCRIVDTRLGGGKLPVGSSRAFDVRGGGATFAAQGGRAGGCSIPDSATAIETTITAVDAGSGFLRAWPADSGQPNATFMNYSNLLNVSNTGTLALCRTACSNQDLRARAFGTPTDLVIDVNGYYAPPMVAVVADDGTVVSASRVTGVVRGDLGVGTRVVRFDRNVVGCSFSGLVGAPGPFGIDIGTLSAQGATGFPDGVYVVTTTDDGTYVDLPFKLEVTC